MHNNHRWLAPGALTAALFAAGVLAALPADAADRSMKDLMKTMQRHVLNGEARALVPLFDQTKAGGKPEYASWAAISEKGRAAAASGDVAGAKATCKECHDAYRDAYKKKYGSKAP